MAAVTFAIGSRPAISEQEALDLAELLVLRGTVAAIRLAGKIRAQASRDPNRGERSEAVDLDPDEATELMAEIESVLNQPGWANEKPALVHLRNEIRRQLGG